MTYLDLINNFWKRNQGLVHPLSSCEAYFYFYLLKECNLLGWENPFRLPTRKIVFELDFRKDTITSVRNSLQQKGFIKFVKGDRRASDPEYSILGEDGELVEITYQNSYQNPYQNPYQNSYQKVDQNDSPTPPIIKTKDIEKEISSDEDIKKDGLSLEDRRKIFIENVSLYINQYGQKMIDEFCDYWTKMKTDSLMRFECEEKFVFGRRLSTWSRNNFSTETKVTDIAEKEKMYNIDWAKVRSWYVGLGLPMEMWTDRRKRAYISIIDLYDGDLGRFKEAIIRFGNEVRKSDWILGLKNSPNRDFEWLFTKDNFINVIDGKYSNNNNIGNEGNTTRQKDRQGTLVDKSFENMDYSEGF